MHQRKSIFFLQKVSLMILSLVCSDCTFQAEIMNDVSLVKFLHRQEIFVLFFRHYKRYARHPLLIDFTKESCIHPSIQLYVCPFVKILCLSFCPNILQSIYPSVWLRVCLNDLLISTNNRSPAFLSVCLYIYLSILHLFVKPV